MVVRCDFAINIKCLEKTKWIGKKKLFVLKIDEIANVQLHPQP